MSRKQSIYNLVNYNPQIPIVPNAEKYKVMIPVLTDTHILYKEPTNRTNFFITTLSYLHNIADIFEANNFKIGIHGGDLHDRGDEETVTDKRNAVEEALNRISSAVEDMYIVYGNHEETYLNNNLFFSYTDVKSSVIQRLLKGRTTLKPIRPFFQAVDKLSFGDVEIHFMHYDKERRYKLPKDKFNICIFHEDIISFESQEELYHHKIGHGIRITDTDIMENVDIAICAHIHTPLLPFRMNNTRSTLVITPGSLCHRTTAEKHTKVDIPIICLNEEGVTIEYIPFNLGEVQETVLKEIDEKQKKVYKANKALKAFKKVYSNAQDLEDLINSLPDKQADIVRNADKPLFPQSLVRYYDRYVTKKNAYIEEDDE